MSFFSSAVSNTSGGYDRPSSENWVNKWDRMFSSVGEASTPLPNFKTLFEDYKLHNPQEHRAYLFQPFVSPSNLIFNDVLDSGKYGTWLSYYVGTIKPFDETKIEFQTVVKDDISYLAPSTEYVNYLKQQDEAFVLSITELSYYKGRLQSIWNGLADYQKINSAYVNYPQSFNAYDAKITAVNNQFKSFVADTCRSLIKLNKPFYIGVPDTYGATVSIPVSVGNFNAYELDKFVCSVFGNVTDDDFIPSVNEEIYNAKTATGCCLKVCVTKELYRKEGVSYEQSRDKIEDDAEFQKWIQSDEYTPYVPPAPYKEITLDRYVNYLNEAQSFARSPLGYAFNTLKPFLEQGLVDLKNGGYVSSYKIDGNEYTINFFGEPNSAQYENFLNMFRR